MTPGERAYRNAIKAYRFEWWRWRNLWRYLLPWLVVLGVPYTLGAWWHGHGRGWLAGGVLLLLVGGVAFNVSVMVNRRDWDGWRWGLRFRVCVRALGRFLLEVGCLFAVFLCLVGAFAAAWAAENALGSWAAGLAFVLALWVPFAVWVPWNLWHERKRDTEGRE